MNICVIYNVCGLSGRENLDLYSKCIDAVLNQKNAPPFMLCLSACQSSSNTKDFFKAKYTDNHIRFNFIEDRVPVNVSFNHSARKCKSSSLIEFDGYLYLSSDIELSDPHTLEKLSRLGEYGMVSVQVNEDNSFANRLEFADNHIMQPGQAINGHCTLFSRSILDYYGNLIPDIFAGYCTESVYFYVNAAIKKNWLVSSIKATHHRNLGDGATSGFCHRGPYNNYWDNLFNSPRRMIDIIADPKGIRAGFGYEECNNVLNHDPNQFDENYLCKNEDLKEFIRDNLYLKIENFDYGSIRYEWA